MKTIIVPTDFSSTSINAAKYATALAKDINADQVLLYNTYIASWQLAEVGVDQVHNSALASLQKLAEELKPINPSVRFELVADNNYLYGGIESLVTEYRAALVIMGITGRGAVEQKLIGTNTTRMALKSSAPVLIVPPEAKFEPIKRVVMGIEFEKGMLDYIPADRINLLVKELGVKLNLVNVGKNNPKINESNLAEYAGTIAIHDLFDEVAPTLDYTEGEDVVEAIDDYAHKVGAQLMVTVTREKTFLGNIFKGSVTRRLAFYTNLPLLVFREKGAVAEE